jgi:hypothetical protein
MEVASGSRPVIYATAINTFRRDGIRRERLLQALSQPVSTHETIRDRQN